MEKKQKKYPVPWFTILLTLITIGMYGTFSYLRDQFPSESQLYTLLGAPSAIEIYQGQYWGVFWNSFLHNRLDLLSINLVGIWLLGAFIERRLRLPGFFLLGLFASVSTSIVQMTMTDDPGIGLSGVNYFLFFFIFTKSFKDERFRLRFRYFYLAVLMLIIGWYWYQNVTVNLNVGLESIVSGIGLGILVALITLIPYKALGFIINAGILVGLIRLLFYAPWSSDWNVNQGIEAHNAGNYKIAKTRYIKALELNPENKSAQTNLVLIRIDELSDQAYYWHSKEEYIKARMYYDEILKIDPQNTWAKTQIKNLP